MARGTRASVHTAVCEFCAASFTYKRAPGGSGVPDHCSIECGKLHGILKQLPGALKAWTARLPTNPAGNLDESSLRAAAKVRSLLWKAANGWSNKLGRPVKAKPRAKNKKTRSGWRGLMSAELRAELEGRLEHARTAVAEQVQIVQRHQDNLLPDAPGIQRERLALERERLALYRERVELISSRLKPKRKTAAKKAAEKKQVAA